ncbi:ankyrin repeat protein [Aspergillus brunneoviolaceus CBS 621.78]|uniref:Ankyrin n=1 Tax=Aspergillus brunneoviolaceus CBS 621.78 TaxID=1450534 RepID=A0ACD1G163_9EURO|nr:ankyrin [Aspergillus brunneoviolaceus CBS 621.78]RAH42970.1 ankyrin [Aspergillus brunneoviolaceus CBS 621.78]
MFGGKPIQTSGQAQADDQVNTHKNVQSCHILSSAFDNRRTIHRLYQNGTTRRTFSDYASSRTAPGSMNRRSSAPVSTRSEFEKAWRNDLPDTQPSQPLEALATTTDIPLSRRDRRNSSIPYERQSSEAASGLHTLETNCLVLPLRLYPTTTGPSEGHKRSVSHTPQPVHSSPTPTRRWQSDVTGSSRVSRTSGSRRERIRSIIRQFRRPSWSATTPSCPARTSNDLTSADNSTAPLLVELSQTGSRADIAQLLENGHDIEARHMSTRRTALLVASQNANEEVVELLLQRNARVDATDKSGSTALHLAASRGHYIDVRNSNGQTALWLAAYYGHLNARADSQTTALHAAAKQGDAAIIHLLDGMMMTALHYACEAANIDAAGNDRRTPLICAAATGQLFAVRLLLKRKASVRCLDDASMTALHWAAFNGHTEVKTVLAKTNIAAAMNGQFAVVEHLIRKNLPLEARCHTGFTPLHYACIANSLEVARLLLISGADIEACVSPDLRRSVHIAAADGSMASLKARDSVGDRALCNFLNRGSPIYLPYEEMSEEDSPLCLAAMGGHLPVRDERGWPPYRHAAYYGHPDEDADLGLTVDRIGFAPSASISDERKLEVQNLLFDVVPSWTFSFPAEKHDQALHRPAPVFWSDSPMETHTAPKTTIIPQELPGTLEQGLPTSRSHTPEHMRREASPNHGPLRLSGMPGAFIVEEQAFVPANEHPMLRSSARPHLDSSRKPGGISLPLETTFARTKGPTFLPESPSSVIDPRCARYSLSSIWMSSPVYQRESEEDEHWDSESSLSSVYTALECEAFELAV